MRQLTWRTDLIKMIGKGGSELGRAKCSKTGDANYKKSTNVSLFEKETKVWKQYGVEPNSVK